MLTKTDVNRITEQFRYFGCNPRETKIYLQCLHLGPSSVLDIERSTRGNRVTVHNYVDQLLEKGLLYETRKGKRRLIVAEEPSVLSQLIQKKENEMTLARKNMEYVTKLLTTVHTPDHSIPTVRFYEGVEGFKRMLEESLTADRELLIFQYVETFAKLIGYEYLDHYLQRRAKKGIHTRLVMPGGTWTNHLIKTAKEYKNDVRVLTAAAPWKSGFFLWRDVVSLLSFTEGKLTCTIIENKDIADFFRTIIFELAWKEAKQG
jgi:sugar-specific transcriptional regulator TrmB